MFIVLIVFDCTAQRGVDSRGVENPKLKVKKLKVRLDSNRTFNPDVQNRTSALACNTSVSERTLRFFG